MLNETLVVLATEFGRTPEINQNDGRDHHPAGFSCVLAGGGIRAVRCMAARMNAETRRSKQRRP
jgi:uncharacterized protein (DUF1501 family)